MALVETKLELPHLQRNEAEFRIIQRIAASADDGPVLMLNLRQLPYRLLLKLPAPSAATRTRRRLTRR